MKIKLKVYQIILLIAIFLIIVGFFMYKKFDNKNYIEDDNILQDYSENIEEENNFLPNNIENDVEKNDIEEIDEIEESDSIKFTEISEENLNMYTKWIDAISYEFKHEDEPEGFNYSSINLYADKTCGLGFYDCPFSLLGTYRNEDDNIICDINKAYASEEEYSQDITPFTLKLKVIDELRVKIVSTSLDSINIHYLDFSGEETTTSDDLFTYNLSNLTKSDIIYVNEDSIFANTYKVFLALEKYQNSKTGPMKDIFVELGFVTKEDLDEIVKQSGVNDASTYIKSNIRYDEFKEKMLEIMTEEYFNKYFSQYKNMDGYVGFCNRVGDFENFQYCAVLSANETEENKYTIIILVKNLEKYYDTFVHAKLVNNKYLIDI